MEKLYRNFIGLYYFSFFALGALNPLTGQYLKEIGLDGTQIGTIVAVGSLVSIFFQPCWGVLSDRTGKTKKIVLLLVILSTFFTLLVPVFRNYYIILLLSAALYIFQCGVFPIIDTMGLKSGINFGNIRQWGAIGFALAVLITGVIADNFGLKWIFIIYGISFMITLVFLKPIKVSSKGDNTIKLKGVRKLFRNKRYLLFLISSFFISGTISAHNSYFGLLYENLGGTITGVGIAFLLFAGSEAPFMKISHRWIDKLGIENMLILSSLISMLRWLWYGMGPSPLAVLILFVLQGISIGTYLVASAQFVSENTREELRGSAISLYASIGMGLGGMVCKFIGGVIIDYIDIDFVYTFMALFVLMGIIPLLFIKFDKSSSLRYE